ncbi:polysaccharide deacetylase family protein [Streptomyces sp. BI20]|uniref:polysaccharide deacetylase family protein n=1 Tax=Streptomyces sp. BI20 TaxID=3403460 RepID=UPI003C7831D9
MRSRRPRTPRPSRPRALAAGALALAVAVLAGGCSRTTEPVERLGRQALGPGSASPSAPPAARPSPSGPAAADADAYRRWGLAAPPRFAPAPAVKPPLPAPAAPDQVPVVDRIPVPDGRRIVFLTFDDGAEKDPAFLRMAADLKLPISMFLTDSVAGSDYGWFRALRDQGHGSVVNNHTLTHPNLRTLGAEAQKREICGQQDRLAAAFGTRPALFRPPYGNHNADTLRAAKGCGLRAAVLWRASMQIHDLQYAEGKGLRPGDIVLAHFRGPAELKGETEVEMTRELLRRIQEQGYEIGRLEDWM